MPQKHNENADDNSFIKDSKLYKKIREETLEIDRLKWLESEKAGFDIGKEKAFYTWVIKHKKDWENARDQTS